MHIKTSYKFIQHVFEKFQQLVAAQILLFVFAVSRSHFKSRKPRDYENRENILKTLFKL